MENQQMGMSPEMSAPAISPDQMAIFDQMRQQISPQEFTNQMLAGGAQVDPQAVSKFTQGLEGLNMPPEVLDALNNMVDAILAEPEKYAQMRQEFIKEGVPEDFLPEQFDPQFFAALNMAVDQMIGEPAGVQAFAHGGIAELKPIAKAIASYGRNGDTMLAHITPAEARMLRRRGGSGTINPDTGLPEFFFDKIFKAVGDVFKSVGDAVSDAFKGVVNTVKEFASSTVGRIIIPIALGFFLGPAAASFLGVTSSIGVNAVMGFVGSAGSTLLAGGNIGDALKAGAVGGLAAGAVSGFTGGSFASGSYSGAGLSPGDALQRQVDTAKDFFGFKPATQAPAPVSDAVSVSVDKAPVSTDGSVVQAVGKNTVTVPDAAAGAGKLTPPGPAPSLYQQAKNFYTENISPSGIQKAAVPGAQEAGSKAVAELMQRVPTATPAMQELAYQNALKAATPGMFATYAPMAAVGLGGLAAFGGFEQKPVESGPITASLQKPATDRMREEGTERENYLQNLPGVKYNEKGEPIYGESTPLPAYTSPGFATPSSIGYASAAAPANKGMYIPPPGSLTNSAGGVYQPYNNSNMYQNMYQNMYPPLYPGMNPGMGQNTAPRRYAAEGGIAALRSGGYPRRTGQISGPGTEKSDDIPAMLSDGEFVMTAAAVRGAGKGNRRDGAKRMYKLMHQLEKNSERG